MILDYLNNLKNKKNKNKDLIRIIISYIKNINMRLFFFLIIFFLFFSSSLFAINLPPTPNVDFSELLPIILSSDIIINSPMNNSLLNNFEVNFTLKNDNFTKCYLYINNEVYEINVEKGKNTFSLEQDVLESLKDNAFSWHLECDYLLENDEGNNLIRVKKPVYKAYLTTLHLNNIYPGSLIRVNSDTFRLRLFKKENNINYLLERDNGTFLRIPINLSLDINGFYFLSLFYNNNAFNKKIIIDYPKPVFTISKASLDEDIIFEGKNYPPLYNIAIYSDYFDEPLLTKTNSDGSFSLRKKANKIGSFLFRTILVNDTENYYNITNTTIIKLNPEDGINNIYPGYPIIIFLKPKNLFNEDNELNLIINDTEGNILEEKTIYKDDLSTDDIEDGFIQEIPTDLDTDLGEYYVYINNIFFDSFKILKPRPRLFSTSSNNYKNDNITIRGKGFLPNYDLTLKIKDEDNNLIEEKKITTTEDGYFNYKFVTGDNNKLIFSVDIEGSLYDAEAVISLKEKNSADNSNDDVNNDNDSNNNYDNSGNQGNYNLGGDSQIDSYQGNNNTVGEDSLINNDFEDNNIVDYHNNYNNFNNKNNDNNFDNLANPNEEKPANISKEGSHFGLIFFFILLFLLTSILVLGYYFNDSFHMIINHFFNNIFNKKPYNNSSENNNPFNKTNNQFLESKKDISEKKKEAYDYITKMVSLGYPLLAIRNNLINNNWPENIVDELFDEFFSKNISNKSLVETNNINNDINYINKDNSLNNDENDIDKEFDLLKNNLNDFKEEDKKLLNN